MLKAVCTFLGFSALYFLASSVVKFRSMPITISSVNIEERKNLSLQAGDTVRVWQKITDRVVEKDKVKEKSRLQAFEGLVLARKHGTEAGGSFTVRRVVDGVGVERIFPLYTPTIDKIEILKRAKVRRAKLYHIRDKATKEIKKAMRHERSERVESKVSETPKEKPRPSEQNPA